MQLLARNTRTALPLVAALTWAGLLYSGMGACSSSSVGSSKITYEVSAKKNLARGEAKLEKEEWLAASKYFSFVKARFPFSRQAVTAELRLADSEFGAKQYLQAIDSYKLFIKFHPTHPMVNNGYASFRIGESYIKLLPGDLWIIPPSYEKDQSATTDAYRELSSFITKYPKSPYRKRAETYLKQAKTRVAKHEMYVAKFYWERDKPNGTILRLRRLLDKHRGSSLELEALDLLARAYLRVGDKARARTTMERLLKDYPRSAEARAAKSRLGRLPDKQPSS